MLATRNPGCRVKTPCDDEARRSCRGSHGRDDELRQRVDRRGTARTCRSRPSRGTEVRLVTTVAEVERAPASTPPRARPHGIVARVAERVAPAVTVGHRRGTDVHHARAVLHEVVDLGHRLRRVGERDHRRDDQPVVVGERPVLLEPAVEGAQRRDRRRDVEAQRLLDPATECREHEDAVESLVVEDADPRRRVLVLAPQRLDLRERARVDPLRDLAPEHGVEAPGHDDRIERRVRDEPEPVPAREQERVLAVLHDLYAAVAEVAVEVAGARVERFVVVLVGVDRTECQVHAAAPLSSVPISLRPERPGRRPENVITFRSPVAPRRSFSRARGAAASRGGRGSSPTPAARPPRTGPRSRPASRSRPWRRRSPPRARRPSWCTRCRGRPR